MKKMLSPLLVVLFATSCSDSIPYSEEHWRTFKQNGVKAFQDSKISGLEIVLRGNTNPTDPNRIDLDGYSFYHENNPNTVPVPIQGNIDLSKHTFEFKLFDSKTRAELTTYKGNLTANNKLEGIVDALGIDRRSYPFVLTEKPIQDKAQLLSTIDNVMKPLKGPDGNLGDSPMSSTPAPPQPLSLEIRLHNEAENIAGEFWQKAVIKCGNDTCYWHILSSGMATGSGYYVGKGEVSYQVNGTYNPPTQLTEAQKLNGVDPQPIEWDGSLNVIFPVGKEIKQTYGSRGWQDHFGFPQMHIKKIKGQWRIYGETQYGYLKFAPIKNCSEIPKE